MFSREYQTRKIQQAVEEVIKGNLKEFKTTDFALIVIVGANRGIEIPVADYQEAVSIRNELKGRSRGV